MARPERTHVRLGLDVEAVILQRVDKSGAEPVCFVTVETNHNHSINYRFVYSGGTGILDMVP